MIDPSDLAILETYVDTMNPVERGLVEELRRLTDEHEDAASLRAQVEGLEEELENTKGELSTAREEVERLEQQLDAVERAERESAVARDAAESALTELKTRMRELLRIPSWVDAEEVPS